MRFSCQLLASGLMVSMLVGCAVVATSVNDKLSRLLECHAEGTGDQFLLYPDMLIQRTDRFFIYSLMNGLSVAVVDLKTGRFNNFNLIDTQDPAQ